MGGVAAMEILDSLLYITYHEHELMRSSIEIRLAQFAS